MSVSVHFVAQPFSIIFFTVMPNINPFSLDLIFVKLPLVNRAISKRQLPSPVFIPLRIHPVVYCTIRPRFQAIAILLVVFPTTDILGSVGMCVGALAVCFIVDPLSFINISVCVVKFSHATRLAKRPLPLIQRPIRPSLFALAVPQTIKPLPFVNRSGLERDWRTHLPLPFARLLLH